MCTNNELMYVEGGQIYKHAVEDLIYSYRKNSVRKKEFTFCINIAYECHTSVGYRHVSVIHR
jgi:hypothetical protein